MRDKEGKVDGRNKENVLGWFSHIERIENSRITERVYEGQCKGSRLVGLPRIKWIDSVNDAWKEKED